MVTDDWLKSLVDPSRDICIRQAARRPVGSNANDVIDYSEAHDQCNDVPHRAAPHKRRGPA